MAKGSKLTEAQWAEIERRYIAGESSRALGREFGVSANAIIQRFGPLHKVASQTSQVRSVAEKLAVAQTALETLPPAHRPIAVSLADTLRNISASLASAAELGAKTAHRLQALSNSEVAKVDDASPMDSIESLRNVGVLTKLANDSASIALNLLSANRDTVTRINSDAPPPPSPDLTGVSTEALREFMGAKNAAAAGK